VNNVSLLTKATVRTYRSRGPQAMAVLGLVLITGVVTGFLLLHVQLRLAIKDLDIDTPKWQREKERCLNELNQLESDIERLKDGNRVLEYAQTELGMISYNVGDAQTLRVDTSRIEAWRTCRPEFESKRIPFVGREVALETLEARGEESLQVMMDILRTPRTEAQ